MVKAHIVIVLSKKGRTNSAGSATLEETSRARLIIHANWDNYDDVTTQLYWSSFVVVVVVSIVIVVFFVVVVVNVVVVTLLIVTDHIIFSWGQ